MKGFRAVSVVIVMCFLCLDGVMSDVNSASDFKNRPSSEVSRMLATQELIQAFILDDSSMVLSPICGVINSIFLLCTTVSSVMFYLNTRWYWSRQLFELKRTVDTSKLRANVLSSGIFGIISWTLVAIVMGACQHTSRLCIRFRDPIFLMTIPCFLIVMMGACNRQIHLEEKIRKIRKLDEDIEETRQSDQKDPDDPEPQSHLEKYHFQNEIVAPSQTYNEMAGKQIVIERVDVVAPNPEEEEPDDRKNGNIGDMFNQQVTSSVLVERLATDISESRVSLIGFLGMCGCMLMGPLMCSFIKTDVCKTGQVQYFAGSSSRCRDVSCPANSQRVGDQCACDGGYYGTIDWVTSIWSGDCQECPTSYFRSEDSSSKECSACPGGQWAPKGQTECVACPEKYWSAQGSPCKLIECPARYQLAVNYLTPECRCKGGYYGTGRWEWNSGTAEMEKVEDTGDCQGCPIGFLSGPLGDHALQATEICGVTVTENCPQGSYRQGAGCFECPTGKFTHLRGMTECEECSDCAASHERTIQPCSKIAQVVCGCEVGYIQDPNTPLLVSGDYRGHLNCVPQPLDETTQAT